MTPDQTVAGVLIGAALISLGALVIACCRSERAERRNSLAHLGAVEAAVNGDARRLSAAQQVSFDEHTAQALRLVATAAVVPMQRKAGEGS